MTPEEVKEQIDRQGWSVFAPQYQVENFKLKNDSFDPGENMVYGTNETGLRGWFGKGEFLIPGGGNGWHIGHDATHGLWAYCGVQNDQIGFVSGAKWVGPNYLAMSTEAGFIWYDDGAVSFYSATGLAVGTTFTPTHVGSFGLQSGQGRLYLNGKMAYETMTPLVIWSGDLWHDATQKCFKAAPYGWTQSDSRVFSVATGTGGPNGTNVETTLLGAHVGSIAIPVNCLVAGKQIRVTCRGEIGAAAGSTVTFKVYIGATAYVTIGPVTPGATANLGFELTADIACRSSGGGGTAIGQGKFLMNNGVMGLSAGTVAAALNTTAAHNVNVTAQYSAVDAANICSCTNYSFEVLA